MRNGRGPVDNMILEEVEQQMKTDGSESADAANNERKQINLLIVC
jgi:hypothetical protein